MTVKSHKRNQLKNKRASLVAGSPDAKHPFGATQVEGIENEKNLEQETAGAAARQLVDQMLKEGGVDVHEAWEVKAGKEEAEELLAQMAKEIEGEKESWEVKASKEETDEVIAQMLKDSEEQQFEAWEVKAGKEEAEGVMADILKVSEINTVEAWEIRAVKEEKQPYTPIRTTTANNSSSSGPESPNAHTHIEIQTQTPSPSPVREVQVQAGTGDVRVRPPPLKASTSTSETQTPPRVTPSLPQLNEPISIATRALSNEESQLKLDQYKTLVELMAELEEHEDTIASQCDEIEGDVSSMVQTLHKWEKLDKHAHSSHGISGISHIQGISISAPFKEREAVFVPDEAEVAKKLSEVEKSLLAQLGVVLRPTEAQRQKEMQWLQRQVAETRGRTRKSLLQS